jgi:hypothetical protein
VAGKKAKAAAVTANSAQRDGTKGGRFLGGTMSSPAPVKRVINAREVADPPFAMQARMATTAAATKIQVEREALLSDRAPLTRRSSERGVGDPELLVGVASMRDVLG